MQCPVCGRAYEPKHYLRPNGRIAVAKPAKTCSRACGSALRFRDRDQMFWQKVDQSGGPDACWPWLASKRSGTGYGICGWKSRVVGAHRVAYLLTHGALDESLDVLHHCDNPPCCNPRHLFQGTHDDNMRDMAQKGRSGDHRGRSNGRALVDENVVGQIRRAYAAGQTQTSLAREYGIAQPTISQIVRRERWVHVSD